VCVLNTYNNKNKQKLRQRTTNKRFEHAAVAVAVAVSVAADVAAKVRLNVRRIEISIFIFFNFVFVFVFVFFFNIKHVLLCAFNDCVCVKLSDLCKGKTESKAGRLPPPPSYHLTTLAKRGHQMCLEIASIHFYFDWK